MGKIISLIGLLLLMLNGCSTTPLPNPNLLSHESRNASASDEIRNFKDVSNRIPSPPPMILPSVYQNISPLSGKTVTLAAENVNLRQILYVIAQTAGLNLILDTDIDANSTITLTLHQASTQEALDTVMELSGCSYVLKGNMLYVRQYTQRTFSIPYIHTQSSFDSALGGDILGASGSKSGSSGSSGSSSLSGKFALNYKNPAEANDFYKQLETNIKESLSPNGKYTLNRFTGTLVVTDTKKVLDNLDAMLQKINKSASRQVLIEAKILEVVLNDEHQLGVNWQTLSQSVFQQTINWSSAITASMSYSDPNFKAVMTALHSAGNVETLSNPNIKVTSGQSALISSGKIVPYWDKQITYTTTSNGTGTISIPEVTYTRRDVLDGISLGVTPKITEEGQIILNIIPVTSSIEGEKFNRDNGVEVGSAPILSIKEAGTVIHARDNELVLIGGLINTVKKDERKSVPLLGDLPGVGFLFSQTYKKEEKHELVILLKLNLVEP
ncbi:MAG: hypothetical protein PHW64_01985 [Sulfuricurvum sp.]|nr:hypothetical protein [Sulfuricurvum sp.]